MAEKLNLARIKKFGQSFEISVDPDAALRFKEGDITNVREVLHSEQIFLDARKAEIAPSNKLMEVFKTDDPLKVAEIIIKEGEIQSNSEHRSKEREQKLNKLVELIHRMGINPTNGLPHPAQRIEAALEEAKFRLDEHNSAEDQLEDALSKIRPIIPIKIEQKILMLTIPAVHVGKSNNLIRSNCKILNEDWRPDGGWFVKVEIPAGFQEELMDKLNAITHGDVQVDVLKE
jgi:ribosome maturation protein SDO1